MYGCKIEPNKQDAIVKTNKTDSVIELFDCLFEIDSSATGSISAATKRKLGIKINHPPLPARLIDSYSEQENYVEGAKNIKGSVSERKGSAAMPRGKKLMPL